MNARALVVLAAVLAALGAALAAPAPAATPPPVAPPPILPVETAGPDGVVQALVLPEGKIAGAVLWPAPQVVEGQTLPAGTLSVAAQAVQAVVLQGEAGARPIVEPGPDFLAVGVELGSGDANRLAAILARLASPDVPSAAAVNAARDDLRKKRAAKWNDPLERARVAAFGLLFPGVTGPWNAAGTPASLARVDAAGVQAALAAVKRHPVEARLAGPAGLAARAAQALGPRLGHRPVMADVDEAEALPASAIVPTPPNARSDAAAMVEAFRVSAQDAVQFGPALSVLLEGVSEGPGSLPQRLRVGLKEVASRLEMVATPGGGGVMLFGVRARKGTAGQSWKILDGTVASLRALPLMDAAIFRARQRLDEQAGFRAADATASLVGFLRAAPWSWPPANRERPVNSADVRQAATRVLAPEHRATAAVGSLPTDVVSASALKGATRIDWSQFDPTAEGLVAPEAPATLVDPANAEGARFARDVLAALMDGVSRPAGLPGFTASYKVVESTPFGQAEMDLRLDGAPNATQVDAAMSGWHLSAKGNEEGGEAKLPRTGASAQLPEPDRLPAVQYREPAVLASAAGRGEVPSTVVPKLDLEGAAVTGLRVELSEGTILLLLVDPATLAPRSLRVWYLGGDRVRPADEDVRYGAWQLVGGVRIATRMNVHDALGTTRDVRLVEWRWK